VFKSSSDDQPTAEQANGKHLAFFGGLPLLHDRRAAWNIELPAAYASSARRLLP